MLALTKKTGYGLIAMTYLARLDGRLACSREISETFDVPSGLLMNVLKELSSAGFIESVRGAHGGYCLARRPKKISVAELITVLEGPIRLAECMRKGHKADGEGICRLVDHCPIADPVHRVQRKLSDFLRNMTLEDLMEPENVGQR